MSAPQSKKISPAEARKRRKATVKIRRNPLLRFLPLIPSVYIVHSNALIKRVAKCL